MFSSERLQFSVKIIMRHCLQVYIFDAFSLKPLASSSHIIRTEQTMLCEKHTEKTELNEKRPKSSGSGNLEILHKCPVHTAVPAMVIGSTGLPPSQMLFLFGLPHSLAAGNEGNICFLF